MAQGFYGNSTGPGSAKLRVYVEFRTTTQEEGRAYVQFKRSVRVDSGNFNGTILSRSWGGQVRIYGAGWYGDSGWVNYGWVNYGSTASVSESCWYTGWSGSSYNSAVNARYSPDVPTWQPRNVNGQAASRRSDTKIEVTWKRDVTTARPYSGIYIDRKVDGGDWVRLADKSGSATSHSDTGVSANHVYQYCILPHNGWGNAPAWQYTGSVATTPAAPTAASASRVDDNKNTVTFTAGSTHSGLYTGHRIERRVNGGAWSFLANVGASVRSYTDKTTQANAYYQYRVRSYNGAGNSEWKTTGTVYNTPAAPGKPRMSRVSDTRVKAEFENEAQTATSLQIQRSTNGTSWSDVRTVTGKATSFEDDPGGGTFYYRIRNLRGSLASAWAYSDGVVTICAPAAPTVTSPKASQVVSKAEASIAIEWHHNPIDGSAQTGAQWRYSTNGGQSWTTQTVTGSASAATLANSFAVNTELSVQVRTKGAHADYGPWSASVKTYVRQVPTVTIEEPADGFEIENTPVHVRIAYSDPSGTLAAATLTVYDADDNAAYSRDVTGALEFDIAAGEWLPGNGQTYRLEVTARSSSTLQGTARRTVTVDYVLPSIAIADAVPDGETGEVRITVHEGRTDALERMESCSLWRESGGVRTLLGEGLHDGDVVVDRYAPLNTDYAYETASFANSGAVSEARFPGRVDSDLFFLYWEGGIASGKWSATDEFSVTPDFETIRVAGKEYPVVAVGEGVEEPHTVTVTRLTRDEAMRFYAAARACMPAVLKTLYGMVFHCMAVPTLKPRLDGDHRWEVSLDVTRVDGDAL